MSFLWEWVTTVTMKRKRINYFIGEGGNLNLLKLVSFFQYSFKYSNALHFLTGERQANINIADGRKNAVILESEAAKMDQVNRAQGQSPLLFQH